MKLIKKISQNRRDFSGTYECEGCKEIERKDRCYDDSYFHNVITPTMKCHKCGESSKTLGVKNEPVQTRYADHEVV